MKKKDLQKKSRADLNQIAKELDLNPDNYKNKDLIIKAILNPPVKEAKIDKVEEPTQEQINQMKKNIDAKPIEGAGDVLEKVFEATGIKAIFDKGEDCGCDDRRKKANKLLPLRFKMVRCFTEEEHNTYKKFRETRTLRIQRPEIIMVCKLYASVFSRPYWEPCADCSPKPLIHMIEKLDTIFKVYEQDMRKEKAQVV